MVTPELYARSKATADLIGPDVMAVASGERGVHVESMMVALGAVAGFGCQIAARLAPPAAIFADPARTPWAEVAGADGQTYYFGDAANYYLLEAPTSFWSVAAGVIGQISTQPVPNLAEIVRHVSMTVGGPDFGVIRFPPNTNASASPRDYLVALWPRVRARLDEGGLAPDEWSIGLGVCAQIALFAAKDVIEPAVGLAIMVESAVAMAKIDPASSGLSAN